MVVCARWAGLSISETADLLGFSSTTISRVYREWFKKEKISSERQLVDKNALLMSEVRGEWADWLEMIEDNSNSNNHRYNQGVQNTISEHNTSNPEADGLQQQKTTPVPLLSDKKQETEDTIHTGSPKLYNRRLKKRCLVWWVSISAATFRW